MCLIDFMLSNVTMRSPIVDDPFMSQLWVLRSNADMLTAVWALAGGTWVCTERGSNKKVLLQCEEIKTGLIPSHCTSPGCL